MKFPKIEGGCGVFILSRAQNVAHYSEWKVGCLYTTVNFQWTTFQRYITAQPKDDTKERLIELYKFNVRNNVSKFEYPHKSVLSNPSWNCFCGV